VSSRKEILYTEVVAKKTANCQRCVYQNHSPYAKEIIMRGCEKLAKAVKRLWKRNEMKRAA